MNAQRDYLHQAINLVEDKQLDIVYRIICQFIPEDIPYPDEVEAIEAGRKEIAAGEYTRFSDVVI